MKPRKSNQMLATLYTDMCINQAPVLSSTSARSELALDRAALRQRRPASTTTEFATPAADIAPPPTALSRNLLANSQSRSGAGMVSEDAARHSPSGSTPSRARGIPTRASTARIPQIPGPPGGPRANASSRAELFRMPLIPSAAELVTQLSTGGPDRPSLAARYFRPPSAPATATSSTSQPQARPSHRLRARTAQRGARTRLRARPSSISDDEPLLLQGLAGLRAAGQPQTAQAIQPDRYVSLSTHNSE